MPTVQTGPHLPPDTSSPNTITAIAVDGSYSMLHLGNPIFGQTPAASFKYCPRRCPELVHRPIKDNEHSPLEQRCARRNKMLSRSSREEGDAVQITN